MIFGSNSIFIHNFETLSARNSTFFKASNFHTDNLFMPYNYGLQITYVCDFAFFGVRTGSTGMPILFATPII